MATDKELTQDQKIDAIHELLITHVAKQEATDEITAMLNKDMYQGNGSSLKSQIKRNSEYRRSQTKFAWAMVGVAISPWVAFLAPMVIK